MSRLKLVLLSLAAVIAAALAVSCTADGPLSGASPTLPPAAAKRPLLTVRFFDVGQAGDGFLVSTSDGHHMLVDGGGRSSGITKLVKGAGVKSLDVVVGTNPDADHIGGLIDVLNKLPVKEVWDSGALNTTITFTDYQGAIEKSGAELIDVRRGETRSLGSLPVQVFHPSDTAFKDRNNNSVVLRIQAGQVSFLFAGDAEEPAEKDMIASGIGLKSTVLKLGHHGSDTSTSAEFLAAVQPEVAVYQAGAKNKYGHPKPATLARLSQAGVKVFGTGKNGRVTITTDGKTYKVETER